MLGGSGELSVLGLPGALILLLPRDRPGAVLKEEGAVVAAALELATCVDSLCVHGDHPGAVTRAHAVRRALEAAGHELAGL